MTANINTILIIGATSGLGEAFSRYFHSKGKKVIAAGRRIERLQALKSELSGLEITQFDVEDVDNIESKLKELIKIYPDLDSVFIMAGKMQVEDFKDASSTSTKSIVSLITTNLIAPLLISRTVVPHLVSLKKPATLITVSSGLGFVPRPQYPSYTATKAGIHQFSVVLRTQLDGTNVKVIELAPPYVDTELDAKFRAKNIELAGGPQNVHPPMPLKEYMDSAKAGFEKGDQKEIAVGFSQMGVDAWRGAFGPILERLGFAG